LAGFGVTTSEGDREGAGFARGVDVEAHPTRAAKPDERGSLELWKAI